MQHLLKKLSYQNTPFHPSDAYSPFQTVPTSPSSSNKTSTTNAANYSPIANASQDVKLNTSSLLSILFISMLSLSSSSKNAFISTISFRQYESRTATTNAKKNITIFPVSLRHPVHYPEAPTRSDHDRSFQVPWRSKLPIKIQQVHHS